MTESSLISLLKSFSDKEWKKFSLFLQSPFFNRSKGLLRFHRYLTRFRPGLDSPKLSKQSVFHFVYDDQADYQESKVSDLMYKMKRLAEEFLVHHELKTHPTWQKQQLAGVLSRREGSYSHFRKASKEAIRKTNKQPESLENLWALLWLHHLEHHHPESKPELNRPVDHLLRSMEKLDRLYRYAKFRYSSELIARQQFLQEELNILLLDACLSTMKEEPQEKTLLALHYRVVKLSKAESADEAYHQAKDLFLRLSEKEKIGPIEKPSVFLILLNYCIRQTNSGRTDWRKELFECHKLGLDKKIIPIGGTLPKSTFLNIAINAAVLHEFDYTRKFIKGYCAFLHPKEQEEALLLSKAYLLFHEGKYQDAKALLIQAPYHSQDFKMRSHSILVRCHYEWYLENDSFEVEEILRSSINKFRNYLKNDCKWADSKKNYYFNFLDVFSTLVRYREDKKIGPQYQKELEELLWQKSPIGLKEWLQRKVANWNMGSVGCQQP